MTIDVYGANMVRRLPPGKEHSRQTGRGIHLAQHRGRGSAADRAVAISGQMHIPVVRYDDGSFQVEPSAVDIKNKLQELGLLAD